MFMLGWEKKRLPLVFSAMLVVVLVFAGVYFSGQYTKPGLTSTEISWEELCLNEVKKNIPDFYPSNYSLRDDEVITLLSWEQEKASCIVSHPDNEFAGWLIELRLSEPSNNYLVDGKISFLKTPVTRFNDCSSDSEICKYSKDEKTLIYFKGLTSSSTFNMCHSSSDYSLPIKEKICGFKKR